jgi:hypothetical protein
MTKSFLLFYLSLSIVGCATGPIATSPLPSLTDPKNASEVVVIRKSSIVGATNSYYITLNEQDVFGIKSGEYTTFKVPAGKHTIGVKCFGGWSPTWKESTIEVSLIPEEKVYFATGPGGSCAKIESINPAEGTALVTKSTYRPFQ